MKKIDAGVYKKILSVKKAYAFDIGCFLIRTYMYMGTLGIVSMLTLSGHSVLFSGSISSMLAITCFLVMPRMGKFMDEMGQRRIVRLTSTVTLCGIAALLIIVTLDLPEWLMYPAALAMGFVPGAPAIARTRWTFLLETGRLDDSSIELKSIYSYEGVLDDLAFMIGPALSIALSAALFPTAGILFGAICLFAGAFILLVCAKATEPLIGWRKSDEVAKDEDNGDAANGVRKKHRVVLRDHPIVAVLFCFTFLIGFFFGSFDTASVLFAQDLGDPTIASVGVSVASLFSAISGFTFGMLKFKASMDKQLFIATILVSLGYVGMAAITTAYHFYAVSYIGALFYPPCVITINAFCEKLVPANRLTESLAWISAGTACGMAFGPVISGWLIDLMGAKAGFNLGAMACVFLLFLAIIAKPYLSRALKRH